MINIERAGLLAVGLVSVVLLAGCGMEAEGPWEAPLNPELETRGDRLYQTTTLYRESCPDGIREVTGTTAGCSRQADVGKVGIPTIGQDPDEWRWMRLYQCRDNSTGDVFRSPDSNCEGHQKLGGTVAIYDRSGFPNTFQLYRCRTNWNWNDRFLSGDPNCEGHVREYIFMGYIERA